MTKKAKIKPALPQTGGSYTRDSKGALRRAEGPEADAVTNVTATDNTGDA